MKGPLYCAHKQIELWAVSFETLHGDLVVVAATTPKKALYQARMLTSAALTIEPEKVLVSKQL